MTFPDASLADDVAFERLLLRSAGADGPSTEATQEAWAKLALSAAGAVALSASGGAAVRSVVGKKSAMWVAAKWLAASAVLGGAVTVGLAQSGGSGSRLVRVQPPARALQPEAAHSTVASELSAASSAGSSAPEPVSIPRVRSVRHRAPAAAVSASSQPPPPAPRTSELGAEVTLLDAARAATSAGANDEALRLVAEYRRAFPRGALSADAEAIAIDALFAQHRDVQVLADRFLARFPNDPHAPRIRKYSSRP